MRPNKAVIIALLVMITLLLIECNDSTDKPDTSSSSEVFIRDDINRGQALAATYCQSCHQLPAPSLLSKATWRNHVLPVMGLYLGINSAFASGRPVSPESDDNYLPVTPAIDPVKWKQIAAYYISKSPEHLSKPYKAEPIHQLPFFEIEPVPQEYVYPRLPLRCLFQQ